MTLLIVHWPGGIPRWLLVHSNRFAPRDCLIATTTHSGRGTGLLALPHAPSATRPKRTPLSLLLAPSKRRSPATNPTTRRPGVDSDSSMPVLAAKRTPSAKAAV